MNIGIVQSNTIIADVAGNIALAFDAIKQHAADHVDVVVFPELFTVGYPPRDLLHRKDLIESNLNAVKQLVDASKTFGVTIVCGFVEINKHNGQKKFYNSVFVAQDGKIIQVRRKTLLPTYDVFAEDRYFQAGDTNAIDFPVFDVKGTKVGVAICEEAWNDAGFWADRLYTIDPVEELHKMGANYIISINASPYRMGVAQQRRKMISAHCQKLGVGFCYVNQVGYNDDIGFDGNSFAMNSVGEVIFHAPAWAEDYSTFNTNAVVIPPQIYEIPWQQEVLLALVTGVKDYWRKLGIKGPAIIGLSGGIDSALVAYIAVMALGKNNVIGVGMPSEFSSNGSIDDAEKLAKKLGIHFAVQPIKDSHESVRLAVDKTNIALMFKGKTLIEAAHDLNNKQTLFGREFVGCKDSGVTDENIQARIRGLYLMSLANYFNGIVLSTGNKSEVAVGYCVDGDSILWTDQGVKTAKELYDDIENRGNICSMAGNRFLHAHRSTKQNVVTITTRIGSKMVVSADHEIEVFDFQSRCLCFRRADNIKENDIVSMRIGSQIWGSNLSLPLFSYAKKKFDYKSFDFSPPVELSFPLAKFLGLCVADGSYCGESLYRIRAAKDDVAEFCRFYLTKLKLPNTAWNITDKDENGCYFVEIYSVQFNTWLRFLGVLHGAYNKLVPDCVANSTATMVKGFLSGVMMDSTTNLKQKFGEITYHSVSGDLADIVHGLLLNLGICSYRRAFAKPYLTKGIILHEVYIPASETEKLLDGFDFLKPSIRNRIAENSGADRLRHKSFADGIYGHDEKIQLLIGSLSWEDRRTLRHTLEATGCIGRKTLLKYIYRAPDPGLHEPLRKVIESNEYYVKVSGVSVVDEQREMFDFSMSDEPVYVIGGHRVHNCTIYGDMCGGLAVISDLLKTKVFDLCRWINVFSREEIIPENTINKPPSAELRKDQKDQDSLPPYPTLDAILERFVEEEKTADEIAAELATFQNQMNYRGDFNRNLENDVYWVCQTVIRNEFKRRQGATGLKLTRKMFKFGWDYCIVHKWNVGGKSKEGIIAPFEKIK